MCDAVRSLHSRPLIDLAVFVQRLKAAQFSGAALLFKGTMGAQQASELAHAQLVAVLSNTVPFRVAHGKFSAFLNGHECSSEGADCAANRAGHACLPGPPDDGTKILLEDLYGT